MPLDKATKLLLNRGIHPKIIYTRAPNKVIDCYSLPRIVRCTYDDDNTVTLVVAFFREKSFKDCQVGD
jgi:hypothetical protein